MNDRAKTLMRRYAEGYRWRKTMYVVLVALSIAGIFFDNLQEIMQGIAISGSVWFFLAEREERSEVEKLATACVEYSEYARKLENEFQEAKDRIRELENKRY